MAGSDEKYLVVIAGPTASGKTSMGIKLANHFNTSIISADSRQFYKETCIGTAKPEPDELAAAPHYFVDHLSIHEPYSVGDFEKEALSLLDELFKEKEVALMVGGSGLFINAVTRGLDQFPDVPLEIRDKIEQYPLSVLQEELKLKDPEYYEEVDRQNPMRLIRALSVIEVSGQAFSSFRKKKPIERPFQTISVILDWERKELYRRIDSRVDAMLERGLLKEVESLLPFKHLNALQTVGYQEFFPYFEGEIPLEESVRLVKRNSRRYAKRQLTWFRKTEGAAWFHPEEYEKIVSWIEEEIKKNNPT